MFPKRKSAEGLLSERSSSVLQDYSSYGLSPQWLPVQLPFRVTRLLATYSIVMRRYNLIISFTHQTG